jgi:hypothetical protein
MSKLLRDDELPLIFLILGDDACQFYSRSEELA